MEINDFYYYKNNVIAKHMMSKALSKHRKALKLEKAKSINDFVFSLLSAIITLYIAYYSKDYGIISVGKIIVSYIFFYYVIFKPSLWIIDKLKYIYRSILIKSYSKVDINELSNDFNNDVINQVYHSYYLLIYNNNNSDPILKNYHIYESLFNVEQALDSINDIFNDDAIDKFKKMDFSTIHINRIKVVFDMLRIIYTKLYSKKIKGINNDLINIKTTYNNLAKLLDLSIPTIT